jgi:hypothetical protein
MILRDMAKFSNAHYSDIAFAVLGLTGRLGQSKVLVHLLT